MAQFHPQTIKFLSDLKKNNNREWFEKNRKTYEAVRDNFVSVVSAIINNISAFDPSVAQQDARKCLFRINRDIRFSSNKDPYKSNMGAFISRGGKNAPAAGYYLHIQPSEIFIAGGIWMPEAPALAKIRQEIDYNFSEFKKIVEAKAFKKAFGTLDTEGKLSRPPKNYDPGNPAIEYLKLKSFVAVAKLDESSLAKDNYVKKVTSYFETLFPLVTFLNKAVA